MKIVAFMNNKGGVGKTSLVYHLAWMFRDLGVPVVTADLDPQSNLSSMFLDAERLEDVWGEDGEQSTIAGVIDPIREGVGDIASPYVEGIDESIGLVVGDLSLSLFEDKLSDSWPRCLSGDPAAFRAMTAFYRTVKTAAERRKVNLVLIDVGPNLGALNRAALIAADHVVIPLAPDLFSLQGLRNLGPTLRIWRREWEKRLDEAREKNIRVSLPRGDMRPLGYVVMQHAVRSDRPVKAYREWIARIPPEYRRAVLGETDFPLLPPGEDPYCLAQIKHYRSLMPLAMEARKPMFHLKPADGAIGAHQKAVQDCQTDFRSLALRIARDIGLESTLNP